MVIVLLGCLVAYISRPWRAFPQIRCSLSESLGIVAWLCIGTALATAPIRHSLVEMQQGAALSATVQWICYAALWMCGLAMINGIVVTCCGNTPKHSNVYEA